MRSPWNGPAEKFPAGVAPRDIVTLLRSYTKTDRHTASSRFTSLPTASQKADAATLRYSAFKQLNMWPHTRPIATQSCTGSAPTTSVGTALIWSACDHRLDDTEHVLLHCPLHQKARRRLLSAVNAALLPLGFHFDELGSDWQKCRFLLGSPPALAVSALAGSTTAYRDILRATAEFLRAVYTTRWVHPQQTGQRAVGS